MNIDWGMLNVELYYIVNFTFKGSIKIHHLRTHEYLLEHMSTNYKRTIGEKNQS